MMIHQAVSPTKFGAGLCALLAGISLTGCVDGADSDSTEIDAAEAGLAATTWVQCAQQGGHCNFSGTRRVRYGTSGDYKTKTFSNGVHCDAQRFNARKRSSARCQYEVSSGAAGMGAAGGLAPPPVAGSGGAAGSAPAAGSGGSHSGHDGTGPYIDAAALPTGSTGVSTRNIGTTSEAPGASDGTGAFRTRCDYSHMLWDDPIVFPNQPGAAHLHAFFGNTDTDAYSTAESIKTGGKSTCRGGIANRSAYWVPSLIDAAGKPVKPEAIDVYYKSGYNGIAPAQIKIFPKGLRMIAGSAKSSAAQSEAYWGCHANYIGHPGSIPQCTSGDNLVMFVEFPQCWDGKNLDSADHKSHMAYTKDGKCPSTHPVAIPAITYNVLYPARDVKGWRLSSDMYETSKAGGFSAHGDWFEGWEDQVSAAFVKNCVNKAVDCHSHLLGNGQTIF